MIIERFAKVSFQLHKCLNPTASGLFAVISKVGGGILAPLREMPPGAPKMAILEEMFILY